MRIWCLCVRVHQREEESERELTCKSAPESEDVRGRQTVKSSVASAKSAKSIQVSPRKPFFDEPCKNTNKLQRADNISQKGRRERNCDRFIHLKQRSGSIPDCSFLQPNRWLSNILRNQRYCQGTSFELWHLKSEEYARYKTRLHCAPKVNLLIWKIWKNILPVEARLKAMGIHMAGRCSCCYSETEDLQHLFIS